MGRAKLVIIAAMLVVVQTVSGHGFKGFGQAVQVQCANAEDSCDWPMFGRTPDGNRVVPDGCGLLSDTLIEKWTFETGYFIESTPIVINNFLYVGSHDNNLYCLNAVNGKLIWKYETGWGIETTPVVSDNKVYFGSYDSFLYCLDALNGQLIWKFQTGDQIWSSPIVYNSYVLFGSRDDFMYCLDKTNGFLQWKFQANNDIDSNPVIFNNKVYFGSFDKKIYCLNIQNSNVYWVYKTNGEVTSNISIYKGDLYVGSTDKRLYCINSYNGQEKWSFLTQGYMQSTPVIHNESVVFGSTDGILYCLDLLGNKKWSHKTNERIYSSPIISDNKTYYASLDKKLYCSDIINGKNRFSLKFYDYISSSLTICNGYLYFGSNDKKIHCLVDSKKVFAQNVTINVLNKGDLCESYRLSANVYDQNNSEIPNPKLEWSVDPSFGTIDQTGLFKPSRTGIAIITCKSGDAVATVEIKVVDFLESSQKTLTFAGVKPQQAYKTTLSYTNNSDSTLNIKLTTDSDSITLEPSTFSVDAGKSFEVLVSCNLREFVPSAASNFTINADYGGCPDVVAGTIINADRFDCLKVSPDVLDFGLVKRGDSKTLALAIESSASQNLEIKCDQPWVELSKNTFSMVEGQKETVDVKIMASSLPASSKLTANVSIASSLGYCQNYVIPLNISTEDSITIKLHVGKNLATINDTEKPLSSPPIIDKGRVMVPLRFISEAFGCEVMWVNTEKKVIVRRHDITFNLWVGKDYAEVNGQRVQIDAPPIIIGGRVMVPLRFIAEPFGADVQWFAASKGITITWPK